MVYKYLFEIMFSILLGYIPRSGIDELYVTLFYIFLGATMLFSTIVAQFYIPTKSSQVFQLLHVLTNNLLFSDFFILAISMTVR